MVAIVLVLVRVLVLVLVLVLVPVVVVVLLLIIKPKDGYPPVPTDTRTSACCRNVHKSIAIAGAEMIGSKHRML